MGQYFKDRKIGTCELMYYMRLDEAKELAKQGEKDDDGISFERYLTDNQTKFRFSFPDEDGKTNAELISAKFDKGFNIPAGGVEEIGHGTITHNSTLKDGFHNINIFIPCPHSEEFKNLGIKMSSGGAGEQWLTVLFQAIRDGKEKTVFACARCGEMQRFDDETVEKIKARAREHFEMYNEAGRAVGSGNQGLYDYAMKVIDRIK